MAQEEYLPRAARAAFPGRPTEPANLADILERVLDKGIVIAGDIQINLLEIELLTIKLRLLIASVDRAREMGINWWESRCLALSSGAKGRARSGTDRARATRIASFASGSSGWSVNSARGRDEVGGDRASEARRG